MKKVDEDEERRKLLEARERERVAKREERRAVRARIAELEDSDPRDDFALDRLERERRAQDWTREALSSLPFADALHLIARSSDSMQSFDGTARVQAAALKRFPPDEAQLFNDALDLAKYFTNVARWAAELPPGKQRVALLETARERIDGARRAVNDGESREAALRDEVLERFEELYEVVRDTRASLRPVWLDDPSSIAEQLTIHAQFIASSLQRSFPALTSNVDAERVRCALVEWVGFNGRAIESSVSARAKGRIAARFLGEALSRTFSETNLRNELAAVRERSPRLASFPTRVPPASNER